MMSDIFKYGNRGSNNFITLLNENENLKKDLETVNSLKVFI